MLHTFLHIYVGMFTTMGYYRGIRRVENVRETSAQTSTPRTHLGMHKTVKRVPEKDTGGER